jgi:hypothetical protein
MRLGTAAFGGPSESKSYRNRALVLL